MITERKGAFRGSQKVASRAIRSGREGQFWKLLPESVNIGFRIGEKLTIANREKWNVQPITILPPAWTDLSWHLDATAIGYVCWMRCLDSGAMTKRIIWSARMATMLFGVLVAVFYMQHTHIRKRLLNGQYIDVFSPSHMLYYNCLLLWEVL